MLWSFEEAFGYMLSLNISGHVKFDLYHPPNVGVDNIHIHVPIKIVYLQVHMNNCLLICTYQVGYVF